MEKILAGFKRYIHDTASTTISIRIHGLRFKWRNSAFVILNATSIITSKLRKSVTKISPIRMTASL